MQRRHVILAAIFIGIIVSGSVAIVRIWRQQQSGVSAASTRVPALPDLSRWPPELNRQLREATAAAQSAPNSAPAFGTLARLYFANGFDAEAKSALFTLRELEPTAALW